MAVKLALWLLASIGVAAATEKIGAGYGLRKNLESRNTFSRRELAPRDVDPSTLYQEYNLSVPIDHFHNDSMYAPHSDGMFDLRYWFDAQYYKPGGPVIVLQGGEIDASTRLPFLQKGLLHQLAQATNGIGVILEHRYYGTSFPTPDLSLENLRFLTTDQALADQAYFANSVVFEGLEDQDLNAPNTPWIAYGGSYAGAFVAILRKLYPDAYWGSISSSGVTEALWDFWQINEPVRIYAPQTCISNLQKMTNVIDNILMHNTTYTKTLKTAFGLADLSHDADFTYTLTYPVMYWQSRNWDPEVNSPIFDDFCSNISATDITFSATAALSDTAKQLIEAGGWANESSNLLNPMLNYIGYMNETFVAACEDTQEACFTSYNTTYYQQTDYSAQTWRSWAYQYCTQWGYMQPGSTVPYDRYPIISRTIDIAFTSLPCTMGFNITTPANVTAINKYGGYNISYPRLAIIDGEQDIWRPVTPHASPYMAGVKNRTNTLEEPFYLIPGAVHHWDENGIFPNETTADLPPKSITDVQSYELEFVKKWLEDWNDECDRKAKRWWRRS